MSFDHVIRGGTVFDGRGGPGRRADVGVRDGRTVAVSEATLPTGADEIDATGCWVTPGFLDLHTHYDAEVEIDPALTESVRHGVTTVVLGSCSLSLALGDPEALADMFCRVEAVPRSTVLPLLRRVKDWDSPADYARHLGGLPLGPHVACLLGHSTIRAAAMGLGPSVEAGRRPTEEEMRRMERWLSDALDAGYLGMSVSTLTWDKMDGERFRSRPMPSVFATWSERRRLQRILRARGRALQAAPDISTKVSAVLFLLDSMGAFVRKPLKTTLISMMDIRADRYAFRAAGWMARIANRFFGADIRLQALPEVFDLWADGLDLVVFEEFGAGAAALHLQTEADRRALLRDPDYRRRFRTDWYRRWLPRAFHRDLRRAEVRACPDEGLVGKTFATIGADRGQDPVDCFLDLVGEHGPALRWYTVMGNDRRPWLERIVSHPDAIIGFSDAGAHLRNMAHYNFPLRLLKLVRDAEKRGEPFMTPGRAVERLTGEIAGWLGLDAGLLSEGKRADLVVVDPEALDDRLDAVHEEPMPGFQGMRRLVRRNDDAVVAVLVNGRVAVRGGAPVPALGRERGYGTFLPAS